MSVFGEHLPIWGTHFSDLLYVEKGKEKEKVPAEV